MNYLINFIGKLQSIFYKRKLYRLVTICKYIQNKLVYKIIEKESVQPKIYGYTVRDGYNKNNDYTVLF